jgi:hypothetical protein
MWIRSVALPMQHCVHASLLHCPVLFVSRDLPFLDCQRNIESKFAGIVPRTALDAAKKLYDSAARALTTAGFDSAMEELHALTPEVHDYVMDIDPKHWAISMMPCSSFGIVTTNAPGECTSSGSDSFH